MTKMLPASFGPLASVFGNESNDDKLSSGINISYPILRIKGKVWSITRGGNEPYVLMRADGDGPRGSIEVVLLAASQYVSKVYYEHGYEEGSSASPDCFSPNGIVPDAGVPKKQNNTCLGCPQNAWGSKITPAGKKAKACADSKRVAVSPLGDIRNEAFGGPMLLRVPAASLSDFGNYGDGMAARGYKYYTIGTKMSFDPNEAYPKLVFEPIRPLNADEGSAVLELRDSQAVASILQESSADMGEVEARITLPPSFPESTPVVTYKPEVTPKVTVPPPPPPAAKTTPLPPPPSPVTSQPRAVDGFGGTEPPKVSTKPKAQAAVPPPPPESPPAMEEVVGDFEASLDAQIENLLPEN